MNKRHTSRSPLKGSRVLRYDSADVADEATGWETPPVDEAREGVDSIDPNEPAADTGEDSQPETKDRSPREPGSGPMSVSGTYAVGSPTLRPLMTPSDRSPSADVGSASTPPRIGTGDEVEISAAGRAMHEASTSGDMRAERLARIKAAIDDGTYETAEKLELAMSRMFDSVWDAD